MNEGIDLLARTNELGVFAFVLMAGLVVVVVVVGIVYGAKRRKELEAFAREHGMEFDSSKNRHVDLEFPTMKCFHQGHSRYGCNFLKGTWHGRGFLGFDYHYTTGSGKNQSHHSFSCVFLTSIVPLKELFIRPEGFFDKITEFFGYDDIDFESAEFSRAFYVKAPEKRWAYDVLHARTIEFLLNQPKFTIQFATGCAMARKGSKFKADQFAQAAEVLRGILDGLPEYVLKQQGGTI
ncbi:MAG: hypothetical protein JXA11_00210 [Phycisphaerae bacterium]|nr:hypothetical protein [Phycisphaerae bacterium]